MLLHIMVLFLCFFSVGLGIKASSHYFQQVLSTAEQQSQIFGRLLMLKNTSTLKEWLSLVLMLASCMILSQSLSEIITWCMHNGIYDGFLSLI